MLSENDEYYAVTLFQQLIEATRQGGNTISPIHFNAEAYKSSDVYKLKEQAEQQANEYLSYKEEQEKMREQLRELEELERRPWYEKAADTVRTFTGELTGYYDYIRASEGVDPVTGEELTEGQRVAAGAMAAAGFIPVVGWAGRIFKGGSAIYKTTKGVKAADQALDVYRNSKTFSNLEKAEMGIYGLVSANGFSEYLTGKDMFGNKLTVEQQENSLYQALGLLAVGGGAYYVNRLQAENGIYQVKRSSISKEINEKKDKAFYMELEDLLKQKDLSMKDFNDMRLKRVSELSTIEIQNMKEIRRSVSPINKDTMMQKVLPPSAKKWLFSSPNEGQIKIGGFLAKVTDTEALNTYDKIFEGLRLDYKGTAEWPNEYLTVDSALAIRFKSVEPDDYKIPFGGQNKDEVTKMIDGDNSDDFIDELQGDPFTGNGFTKSKSYIIPEYENRIKVDLYDGVELYEISKDGETLIATYSQEDRKFTSIRK
ncbi:hypothetical protein FS935_16725 [Metabacillus litoralis]|uniref:Pre-toxin TG domain-containing protein n=1 Tax=Metabacillus litoralis TaxID=152268 RepID=A0A5C6W194_9BACI|nr:pre-toxin TG domain-containing protein [Metabacillus litoralis]TXC89525.1 hypothetical protein FS935_16725 [Metabacillus litoralis]